VLVSPADIRAYLDRYQAALEAAPDAKLALWNLPDKITFASRDLDLITEQAAAWARQGRDVYLHVHLQGLAEGNGWQRGSADRVRVAAGLPSDIDAVGPGRKKDLATLCPTVEVTLCIVNEFEARYAPLRMAVVVGSGHGIYPFLAFREPLVLEKIEDKQRLESLSRRFHYALHQIASEHGYTSAVDYCDAARVLRLPGSVNFKDRTHPSPYASCVKRRPNSI
jgi:hypothetical protein